jgi:hypothetical protein
MSAAGSPSDQSTEAAGFRSVGQTTHELRIEAWGYWTGDVATAFTREAPLWAHKLGADAVFVLDAKQLKPQAAEGQEALRTLFRALSASSFARGILHTDNVLTRMQLTRLLRECGVDARMGFE